MKIIYKLGSLVEATERVIVQQVNARGKMNSGVAKAIRDKYPSVYTKYENAYQAGLIKLGFTQWIVCDPHIVVNIVGQEFYRRDADDDRLFTDYEALARGIGAIDQMAKGSKNNPAVTNSMGGEIDAIAFPLLGCGLANGDWNIVSGIIELFSENYQPVVYILEGEIPEGIEIS